MEGFEREEVGSILGDTFASDEVGGESWPPPPQPTRRPVEMERNPCQQDRRDGTSTGIRMNRY